MTTSSHISTHRTPGRHARGLKDIHTLKDNQNDSGQDMAHYHIPQPPLPPLPPLPLLPLLPLLLVAAAAASHSSLEEEEVVGQTPLPPRSNEYCSMLRGARVEIFARP